VIEWAAEPCVCGRTSRLIKGGVVGRADDITKVKGVLLAPSAIEEVVRGIAGLGDEYEVIVEKVGDSEKIKLRVEVLPDAEDQCTLIENELVGQLRLRTNLRYDIEICGCETLPRYEVKAKRFKDLRKKE
jgi:phenylacetate-CoA ligase